MTSILLFSRRQLTVDGKLFLLSLHLFCFMFGFISFSRLCFPLWLLTNILFFILLRYGAYFLTLTGLCMVTANILWATIRNYNELKIPFEDAVMEFTFGGSFYICLITGIFYLYTVCF